MLDELLRQGFEELKLPLSDSALAQFRAYYEYLEEQNQVMNLTAISGEEDVARLHFLDCASLLGMESFAGKRAVDVGTGAGFPGLVLKLACPDTDMTLLDSLDKRIGFLRRLCEKLGLEDVPCVHMRAEEAPKEYRESFDIAVSRAVARLNLLCELCLPLVKVGGVFIAMKGPDIAEELQEAERCIAALGGKTERVEKYTVPGTDVSHSAVVIRKLSATPAKYPRRWAQIKSRPL